MALIQTGCLKRTSSAPEGRTLAHVSHLQGAMTLFLCLATAKGYAMLYTAHEACNVSNNDVDQSSRCTPLRWLNCVVIGALGYVTYVAILAYQRLAHHYAMAGAADAAVASLVAAARARIASVERPANGITEVKAGEDRVVISPAATSVVTREPEIIDMNSRNVQSENGSTPTAQKRETHHHTLLFSSDTGMPLQRVCAI